MEPRLPVEQIMKRKVVTLGLKAKAKEAAVLMRTHKIGGLVIVDEQKPVGMVTLKDLAIKVMALGKNPETTVLEDIMSSPVVCVDKSADMNEVAKLMAENDIRRVVVEDKGRLVGIVTDKDILQVQPAMVDVLKEFLGIYTGKREDKLRSKKGLCEVCDSFDNELVMVDSRWMCPDCRKDVL